MIDNKTVKKMKEADKLKRNATTKDQMVSALNKINYIRKKAKEESMQERAPRPLNRSNHTHTVSIDGHGQHQVVAKSMAHAKKVAFKKAGISKLHGHPTMEPKTRILGELALKRDPKQKNLLIPVKGAKGTSKYTRMKAMTKAKEKKESQIDEARPSKDDEEGAEHIIMQLRKSVSLRGNKDVMFQDGSSKKVSMKDAQRALDKYNRMKPMDRIKLQKQYEKDFRSFSQAIK